MNHETLQNAGFGPDNPEPFPSDGAMLKFLQCPVCKNKGLAYWFAPLEDKYETMCIKCGARHGVHEKGDDFSSPSEKGAEGNSQLDGYRHPQAARYVDQGVLEATGWFWDLVERRDQGGEWWKR